MPTNENNKDRHNISMNSEDAKRITMLRSALEASKPGNYSFAEVMRKSLIHSVKNIEDFVNF